MVYVRKVALGSKNDTSPGKSKQRKDRVTSRHQDFLEKQQQQQHPQQHQQIHHQQHCQSKYEKNVMN